MYSHQQCTSVEIHAFSKMTTKSCLMCAKKACLTQPYKGKLLARVAIVVKCIIHVCCTSRHTTYLWTTALEHVCLLYVFIQLRLTDFCLNVQHFLQKDFCVPFTVDQYPGISSSYVHLLGALPSMCSVAADFSICPCLQSSLCSYSLLYSAIIATCPQQARRRSVLKIVFTA